MARRRSIDLDPMLAASGLSEWEQQQERAFVGWVNSLLRQHPSALSVEKLESAFVDGVALICLLESLAGTSVGKKYRKQATKRIQQIENLNIALAFVRCQPCASPAFPCISLRSVGAVAKSRRPSEQHSELN